MDPSIGIIFLLIVGAIVLFVLYYVVKAVRVYLETVNQSKKPIKQNKTVNLPPVIRQKEVQLMICPQCKNTYSDLSLSFCLDDGQLLRKTSVLLPPDPEETVISGKFR